MGQKEKTISPTTDPSFQLTFSPPRDSLPSWVIAGIFAILIGIFFGVIASFVSLPKAVYRDNVDPNATVFIAENALDHIRYLTVNIGTRFQGTPNNEVHAVNFLYETLQNIARNAHPSLKVEVEKQMSDIQQGGHEPSQVILYRKIQNVVARVIPAVDTGNHILLNSHFDTVPNCPGAGDDASMVGVMIELFRVLSLNENQRTGVVFLFNSPEELALAGGEAFVKNHPWWQNVKVLLNLESSGPNGKEMMFQASPEHPWLLPIYNKFSPSPYAQALAEELFQGGFIPSRTDYQIFREYNNKLGAMDFATSLMGRRYHTAKDEYGILDIRSLQHSGDNILEVLRGLDQSEEMRDVEKSVDEDPDSRYLFYDVIGLFVMFYSKFYGKVIASCIFVVMVALITWCLYDIKQRTKISNFDVIGEYILALVIHILATGLAVGFIIGLAYIYDAVDRTMTYYSAYYLVAGLYFVPFFLIYSGVHYLYVKLRKSYGRLPSNYIVQLGCHAHCTILILILIITAAAGLRSSYIFHFNTIGYGLSIIVNSLFGLHHKGTGWTYSVIVGQLISICFYFYLSAMLFVNFIPFNARRYDGGTSNPETFIAIMTALFGYLISGFLGPLMNMSRNRKYVFGAYFLIFVAFIVVSVTPEGFPFRETSPQRFTIWHAKRTFFDYNKVITKDDSGFYVFIYDRYQGRLVEDIVPAFKRGNTLADDCESTFICGVPYLIERHHTSAPYNRWIPAETPFQYPRNPSFSYQVTEQADNRWRYDITVMGGPFLTVHYAPLKDVKVASWSFSTTPTSEVRWNDREVYMVHTLLGGPDNLFVPFSFHIILEVPSGFTQPYFMDLAFSSQFVEFPEYINNEFQSFIDDFPEWANVQAWTGYLELHQIGKI